MQLTCILGAFWILQMEVKLVHIQIEHHNDKISWSHNLTLWPRIFKCFWIIFKNVKYQNHRLIDAPWVGLEICHHHFLKTGEIFWPSPQPIIKNGDQCVICYNLYGPKGPWQLGTCQHILSHPWCWITLMVIRRICLQYKASFDYCLYAQFNPQVTMPKHWEYNQYDMPKQPQAWCVDMWWIGKWACQLLNRKSIQQMVVRQIPYSKDM